MKNGDKLKNLDIAFNERSLKMDINKRFVAWMAMLLISILCLATSIDNGRNISVAISCLSIIISIVGVVNER